MLTVEGSISSRDGRGGTAQVRVAEQLAELRQRLAELSRAEFGDRSCASVEAFFDRPVEEVAPELLGSTIACGGVRLRLTEVEAYQGMNDAASHSYRGPTPRNEVMFGPAGRVYVYFIYGMHWAVNLVCEGEGHAAAVLLRGAEVVSASTWRASGAGESPIGSSLAARATSLRPSVPPAR